MTVSKKSSPRKKQSEKIVVQEELPKKNKFSAFLRFIGWTIVYGVVFYLGNLTGEYVAATMPVYSLRLPKVSVNMPEFKMPSISWPAIQVSWNKEKLASIMSQKNDNTPSRTQPVIIQGNFLNMPLEGATTQEKDEFRKNVETLAVEGHNIAIEAVCALNPAFVRVAKGEALEFTNKTSDSHSVSLNTQQKSVIEAQGFTVLTVSESGGVYPIHCDSAITGFYIVL
jgi:plastocyanin